MLLLLSSNAMRLKTNTSIIKHSTRRLKFFVLVVIAVVVDAVAEDAIGGDAVVNDNFI